MALGVMPTERKADGPEMLPGLVSSAPPLADLEDDEDDEDDQLEAGVRAVSSGRSRKAHVGPSPRALLSLVEPCEIRIDQLPRLQMPRSRKVSPQSPATVPTERSPRFENYRTEDTAWSLRSAPKPTSPRAQGTGSPVASRRPSKTCARERVKAALRSHAAWSGTATSVPGPKPPRRGG